MKQTPLHDVHVAAKARMVEFGGWHMPVQYGPILDEITCVRERVGLFDLSHMGRVKITGPDAVAYLDSLATNFCARIAEGAIRYGLFCREDGGALDDLLVYRDPDGIYLVVNASNTERDLQWMRDHVGNHDVSIEDQTEDTAMLALQGQASERVLASLVEGTDLGDLGYYKFTHGTVAGLPEIRISRTGYTGEDGFEVYLPAGEGAAVWHALLEAGADAGIAPIGLGARDTLRLEAGMPLYGHEIDEEHNPIEAGLNFGVSFAKDKGDWIGKAALKAVRAEPKRQLVGLTNEGKRIPRQGYALFDGDEEVGVICSGSLSPTIGKNIATGYLPVDRAEAGRVVQMDIRGTRHDCTVVELPFFSRTRK